MVNDYVLDTNVALYALGGRLLAPLPVGHHHVSIITEMELLAYPGLDPASEARIRRFIANVTVEGITDDIKEKAIDLRRLHKLKLPDAIVAATALELQAMLLTNDAKILSVPGLSVQSVAVS